MELKLTNSRQLELDKELRIPRETVQSLVLSVRAGMPNNPYHNWIHIVDVTQVRGLDLAGTHLP
jgi:hypothetical protein